MALTLFLYHSVDDSGSFLSVSPARFAEQMTALARSGRRVLSVADAFAAAERGESVEDVVCITFDDAYQSVADHAWPILKSHGFGATVYFVEDVMGGRADWLPRLFPAIFGTDTAAALAEFDTKIGLKAIRDPDLKRDPVGAFRTSGGLDIMTWETARRLIADGLDPGGHTKTHPFLSHCTDAELLTELRDNKTTLEDALGVELTSFAYPFGDLTPHVAEKVKRAGYKVAVTSRVGAVAYPLANPFTWRRIGVWPNVPGWKMRLYVSSFYARLRAA